MLPSPRSQTEEKKKPNPRIQQKQKKSKSEPSWPGIQRVPSRLFSWTTSSSCSHGHHRHCRRIHAYASSSGGCGGCCCCRLFVPCSSASPVAPVTSPGCMGRRTETRARTRIRRIVWFCASLKTTTFPCCFFRFACDYPLCLGSPVNVCYFLSSFFIYYFVEF